MFEFEYANLFCIAMGLIFVHQRSRSRSSSRNGGQRLCNNGRADRSRCVWNSGTARNGDGGPHPARHGPRRIEDQLAVGQDHDDARLVNGSRRMWTVLSQKISPKSFSGVRPRWFTEPVLSVSDQRQNLPYSHPYTCNTLSDANYEQQRDRPILLRGTAQASLSSKRRRNSLRLEGALKDVDIETPIKELRKNWEKWKPELL